ncbi:radical SAM/SPASM domain-containing protein [Embleya sp. AB8]|uniref:radical SAM/SPASM domain-containing protein n=1 Tax=Embleya sp. AB8 TaxID=3156304 RepID=UPI003C7928F6
MTGGCQLRCTRCLSSSSPQGTHGTMTRTDWCNVIIDAADLGVSRIQLIGGEPTLYPHWVDLVELALTLGRQVEVYSNLYKVLPAAWDVFERPGVLLATSYYSDDPAEHDAITTQPGSHARTRANIAEAVRRGIPIRAGIVNIQPGQRVAEARADLVSLGVKHIQTDRVRAVGRAAKGTMTPSVNELCGRCGDRRAAVLPNGDLTLCVLSRFMPVLNVRSRSLGNILGGSEWRAAVARIPARASVPCQPDDTNDCDPSRTEACDPAYD